MSRGPPGAGVLLGRAVADRADTDEDELRARPSLHTLTGGDLGSRLRDGPIARERRELELASSVRGHAGRPFRSDVAALVPVSATMLVATNPSMRSLTHSGQALLVIAAPPNADGR
jgi:hypothetical protein